MKKQDLFTILIIVRKVFELLIIAFVVNFSINYYLQDFETGFGKTLFSFIVALAVEFQFRKGFKEIDEIFHGIKTIREVNQQAKNVWQRARNFYSWIGLVVFLVSSFFVYWYILNFLK